MRVLVKSSEVIVRGQLLIFVVALKPRARGRFSFSSSGSREEKCVVMFFFRTQEKGTMGCKSWEKSCCMNDYEKPERLMDSRIVL